ncbi:hypothetical protein [Tenacibaculum sp.]|uniref:hypothetical protein n=1 Tax=Tenacibaculum sp. TaxID=1906242 RepID=UPI003AA80BA6
MRKVILSVALLLVSGVLTSCTDVSEDNIQEKEELEIQNTGGEEDQDPEEDPDSKGASTKGRTESIDTGGETDQDPDEPEDPDSKETSTKGVTESTDTGGGTVGGNEHDPDPEPED